MTRKGKRRRRQRHTGKPGAAESATKSSTAGSTAGFWEDCAIFAAIVLFAFVLRHTYILQLRASPLFENPQMDELYHDQWAQAIAAGDTFVEGPYFRAPLYPAFLGVLYRVFGHGYLVPRVSQVILGSLSCGLLFLLGRKAFGCNGSDRQLRGDMGRRSESCRPG